MSAKKALIVDDSKLAQFVLKKMLVEHELAVDTTESAEEALDYLVNNKPDVIFLDHSMSGMNGLQALKAIKDNPDTATIPVMMYTSQDDGMYMSQARALGALDILPKQLKPVELAQVLDRLRLTKEALAADAELESQTISDADTDELNQDMAPPVPRGIAKQRSEQPINPETQELSDLVRNAEAALEKESLKQFLKLKMDDQHQQITDSVARIEGKLDEIASLTKGDRRKQSSNLALLPLLYLGGLGIIGLLLVMIYSAIQQTFSPTAIKVETTRDIAEKIQSADAPPTAQGLNDLQAILEATLNNNNQVEAGSKLLGDNVSDILINILDPLQSAGFTGTVKIVGHSGDFCYSTNEQGKLVLAAPNALFSDCQVIEPPSAIDQVATAGLRTFVNQTNEDGEYDFRIELDTVGNIEPIVNYPQIGSSLTAGTWNQIASFNNRVHFSFED